MNRQIRHVVVLVGTTLLTLTLTSPVRADTDFYQPPSPLPSGNDGDLIRYEPMKFHLDPLRLTEAPATAYRVMYLSRNTNGRPIAVTGVVLRPHRAWLGPGRRPIVAYASGTQGVADKCAPSRQTAQGNDYEGALVSGFLEQGYAVAMTDYEGLGTPGNAYICQPGGRSTRGT